MPPTLNPISYAAVCRHWRQVAVNHQPLWTHIDLAINVMDENGKYHSPEPWISRSKGAPLYVQVLQPRFCLNDEYRAEEEEECMTDRPPAPMVKRIMNFLTPLMSQVCSLTTFLSWPYDSTLERLLDCWAAHGTPGQAKVLKALSNMELGEIAMRSPESYGSFLEPLEVLHLRNTILPWSSFLFHNLVEFKLTVGEGQRTMALPELAAVLSSCPKLQCLSLDSLIFKPFPAPQPKAILFKELRELRIAGFSNTFKMDGTAMLESALTMIVPGQNPLNLEVDLSFIRKSPQQAIDVVRAFVERANVTQLRLHGSRVTGFRDNPYFASQLGPLPRVQALILEEFFFCDVTRVESSVINFDGDGPTIDEYNNPRSINPELVLWPNVRSLYLRHCVLEEEHLRCLMSLHSIQAMYMHGCFNNSKVAPHHPYVEPRGSMEHFVRLLSQFVPKVVHYPAWEVIWSSLLP
ncbi:hypothetical protein FRC09_013205 [Ceratobasidium sp. 395]|nr:hypothetical protein FRC09_013205 [Ceratobasidium sp. 395]